MLQHIIVLYICTFTLLQYIGICIVSNDASHSLEILKIKLKKKLQKYQ